MGYLADFDFEIFVSYAHVDELTTGEEKFGWVTQFYDYLETMLWKRFGDKGAIKIWRDPELAKNQDFNQTIRNAINRSALFIALHSEGWNQSSYCQQELSWFCSKAQAEKFGLAIGDRRRVFNLLLNNIPWKVWPKPFVGAAGYTFHDSERDDDLGFPCAISGPIFQQQLRALVNDITTTLKLFRQLNPPTHAEVLPDSSPQPETATPVGIPKTVFLATTSDNLRRTQERVANELQQKGIRVVSKIPPPFEAKDHDDKVIAELRQADLAVHLLDAVSGFPMVDVENVSYPQRQALLGVKNARAPLIWLPKTADMPKVEEHDYAEFLSGLENEKREQDSYKFIRELQTPALITSTILDELKREPPGKTSAVLLDTHFKDQPFAHELYQALIALNIKSYINPEEDDPRQNMIVFEALLKKVNLLIVVFGRVNADWVQERIGAAFQIAYAQKFPLKICGVYLAPVTPAADRFQQASFPTSLPIYLFDNLSSIPTLVTIAGAAK